MLMKLSTGKLSNFPKMNILITGFPGQDAQILTDLMSKDHNVFILTRRSHIKSESRYNFRGVLVADIRQTTRIVDFCFMNKIDAIINCAAFSSVAKSWRNPEECLQINAIAVESILSLLRKRNYEGTFYQLGSTDMFGREAITTVNDVMKPWSPYGESKCKAFESVLRYREKGGHACNIILTNHDSSLRPRNYVIVSLAEQIAHIRLQRNEFSLVIQNPNISRDWAHARDICFGIKNYLESDIQSDIILATGKTYSLREIVNDTCSRLEIEPKFQVTQTGKRVIDFPTISVEKQKSWDNLNWFPQHQGADTLHSIAKEFISAEQ